MDRHEHTSTHTERPSAADRPPYEPPRVEDVDTSHGPVEAVPLVAYTGVQESERWH